MFESWHIGPHRIVPETQQGTFTKLVRDAIKYLKGTGQKLDLSVQAPNSTVATGTGTFQTQPSKEQRLTAKATTIPLSYQLTLTNRGDVACMPAIRALEGGAQNEFIRYSVAGRDVSSSVHLDEGHVFTEMVSPGAKVTMLVTLLPAANQNSLKGKHSATLQAFWNPQDTGAVRDVVSISASFR